MIQAALKAQDVFVLAKLIVGQGQRRTMAILAGELGLSASQVHGSLKRLEKSRLVATPTDGGRPIVHAVEEFLIYGLKYVFPAQRGEVTRGIPTAHAAPPLNHHFASGADLPPVWPDSEGEVRGTALDPLHKMVPGAVRKDPALYELLALIEALRDGRARERQLAERELATRLRRLLHG
ncbi:MAG: hypothetical protein Q8O42_23430 [Acidobacteriota bacterium]|nr:hypothetical protein [Acidobacteriota bacterium]